MTATIIKFPKHTGPAIRAIHPADEASELKAASELLKIAVARPEKRDEIIERVLDGLAGFKGAIL